MEEKAFNLLDEPWIRVIQPDCTVREVPLTEALTQAHTFSALAGELPTQDIAILRLLLAVLHTVFSRVDETGAQHPIQDEDDALDRWEALWNAGRFPEKPIRDNLENWHERFYLFHPERPFYQVKEAEKGTEYKAAKLNGAISESGKIDKKADNPRFFANRVGKEKNRLNYAEAARWLINLNAFDDASGKPSVRGKARDKNVMVEMGVAWVGELGVVAAQGNSLFETLMLNFVLLNTAKHECWGKNTPIWELEQPRTKERCKILLPNNQAELLTLQSRRIILVRNGNSVTGYKMLGGDTFDSQNAYVEQMTLWEEVKQKGAQPSFARPKQHDVTQKVWREFPTLSVGAGEVEKPGVIKWQEILKNVEILEKERMIKAMIVSIQYGKNNSCVNEIFCDTLSFHLSLLDEKGKEWCDKIAAEVTTINAVAAEVKKLGKNIYKASGERKQEEKKGKKKELRKEDLLEMQFYDRIDIPFRRFLETADASDDYDKILERLNAWHDEQRKIAFELAEEEIAAANPSAFFGRTVQEKVKQKTVNVHYSLSEAYSAFKKRVNSKLKG